MEKYTDMKNKIVKRVFGIFIIFGLLFITSCEGYRCGDGTVLDSVTKEPIDSVLCKVLTGSEEQFTDSVGAFSVCNDFGGCVPDCGDIEIEFSKTGYKTEKITNPNGTEILMEKE